MKLWGELSERDRYQPTEKEIIVCLRSIVMTHELLKENAINDGQYIRMIDRILAKARLVD